MDNKTKDDLANKAQSVIDEAEGLNAGAVPDELVPVLQAGFDLAEAVLEAMSAESLAQQKASLVGLRTAIAKRLA